MRLVGTEAERVLAVLHDTADAVAVALGAVADWGLTGEHPGQHHSDLAADAAAVDVLERAGFGVLSEESGARGLDRDVVVVVDPLDGSTNAAHGIPWYATSLCALDGDGPLAALVVDLAHRVRFEATRGGGARRDGAPIRSSGCQSLPDAVVALAGWPPVHLGWRQYRSLGAAALDLCAVAAGVLDGFVDCTSHGVWDYAGALLVCQEAGAVMADASGRDLVVRDLSLRRTPLAAATPELLDQLVKARARF